MKNKHPCSLLFLHRRPFTLITTARELIHLDIRFTLGLELTILRCKFLQQLSSPSKNIFEISLAKAHIFLPSLLLVKGLSQLKHIILLQINRLCLYLEGCKTLQICKRWNDLVFLVHCRSTGVEITDYQSSSSSIFTKMRKKDGNGNKYIFPC